MNPHSDLLSACARWFCKQISLYCSCKKWASTHFCFSTFSITIQAAMRIRNTTKFFSSITTFLSEQVFLLKGFLKTWAATEADLTANRLFSSSFAEPRTAHSGTLWQDISCAKEKSWSASFPHHHMMLYPFSKPSRRNPLTHSPNSSCQIKWQQINDNFNVTSLKWLCFNFCFIAQLCPVKYQSHCSEKYPQKKGKKRSNGGRKEGKIVQEEARNCFLRLGFHSSSLLSHWAQLSGAEFMLRVKLLFQSNSHFHLLFVMPGHSDIVRHWVSAWFSEKNIHSSNLRFDDLKCCSAPAPLVVPDA